MSPRPYKTFRRKNTKGRTIYYGAFFNPSAGKHEYLALYDLAGRACTSKAAADEAVLRIMDSDRRTVAITVALEKYSEIKRAAADAKRTPDQYLLGLHDARMASRAGELLSDYVAAFWEPDSMYIKAKAAAKAPLSAMYLGICRSAVSKHIVPWLRRKHPTLTLQGVGPTHLEALKAHLVDKGLGPARVNGIMKALRVPLGEAWRLEAIPSNPASKVHKLPDPAPKREIFTMAEARLFFEIEQDQRYKAANLTAALAGLRLGEILGLQAGDIIETTERVGRKVSVSYHLHVCNNWQAAEEADRRLKGPKHSTLINIRARDVPIPERLALALREVAERNPNGDGFVIWGENAGTPPSTTIIEQHYNRVVHKMGIKEQERKRRKLSFHAWRHWYNSNMRGQVADYQLRMLTGHTSDAMTDRYTEITDEQRAAVGRVAGRLLE